MNYPSFRISTGNSGFHMTFRNGYTVSVQFGPANYGDHHDCPMVVWENGRSPYHQGTCGNDGSYLAEVAVIHKGDLLHVPEFEGTNVGGYYSAEKVLALMNWAAAQDGDHAST